MKLTEILDELNEGMATGSGVENTSLEIEDPTSTKPEKGKTVKEIQPKPSTELGKDMAENKKEQAKKEVKPADFSMINKGMADLAKGSLSSKVDLKKEIDKVKEYYKTNSDTENLAALEKVDMDDINMIEKIKANFKKTGDFMQALAGEAK